MIDIEKTLAENIQEAIKVLYQQEVEPELTKVQKTNKEFTGDYTYVVFPILKRCKKSPDQAAKEIGNYLLEHLPFIEKYEVIKGYLNLSLKSSFWIELLHSLSQDSSYGHQAVLPDAPVVMVEYSSPNTNKPLHLGHIRNNLLGYAISKILEATGHQVIKANLINDRGIHICKSMLAWKKWGKGATPESTGIKGDHLVGDYYVLFEKEYRQQVAALMKEGMTEEEAERNAPLIKEAQAMLVRWEQGDKETHDLWKMMNGWVYKGFDATYQQLGVSFDKIYYESDTYLLGKELVMKGLEKGIFYRKEDDSIWADLTADGLDHKLLLRSDGTSVYITQDIGTAHLRFNEYALDKLIYVVGNEQNYHFQVLSLLLKKLEFPWADRLVHLSYGMVELPEGKMKSREGTVVDADDLMEEMIQTARQMGGELGKLEGFSEEEKENIFRIIGLGALKYFILKVDPKKNMLFNPKESIDFDGNTGPFIQYSYARIRSILRKAAEYGLNDIPSPDKNCSVSEKEKYLVQLQYDFPFVVKEAAEEYNPSHIANYCYEMAKEFNQFYHDYPILKEPDEKVRNFRLLLCKQIAYTLKSAMNLLGIEMPERM